MAKISSGLNFGNSHPITKLPAKAYGPARAHIQQLEPSFRNAHWPAESPERATHGAEKTLSALDLRDVFGLEALVALADLKLHKFAFAQRFISVHLNSREVNEDVLSRLTLNEPVPLRGVEPLHHTLFSSQRSLLLSMKSRLRRRNAGCSGSPGALHLGLRFPQAALPHPNQAAGFLHKANSLSRV